MYLRLNQVIYNTIQLFKESTKDETDPEMESTKSRIELVVQLFFQLTKL